MMGQYVNFLSQINNLWPKVLLIQNVKIIISGHLTAKPEK